MNKEFEKVVLTNWGGIVRARANQLITLHKEGNDEMAQKQLGELYVLRDKLLAKTEQLLLS